MMGAPTIMVEKLPSGDEVGRAFDALADYLGRPITHLMSAEAGGMNSTIPIALAARRNLPLVDCDLMGRAFPRSGCLLPTLSGGRATPMAMADERGNVTVISTIDNAWTERLARAIVIEMGGTALIGLYALTGAELERSSVWGSMSLCIRIGKAVRTARERGDDPLQMLLEIMAACRCSRAPSATCSGGRRAASPVPRSPSRAPEPTPAPSAGCTRRTSTSSSSATARCWRPCPTSSPSSRPRTRPRSRRKAFGTASASPSSAFHATRDGGTREGLALVGPDYFGYELEYVPVEHRVAAGATA